MAKPTQVEFEGKVVDADLLDSKTIEEQWSLYGLEDGTTIKLKQILVSVAKLRDTYKPNGEPIYVLKIGGVLDAEIPRSLYKGAEAHKYGD